MREIRTSGLMRGSVETEYGMRLLRHQGGNPETELCRSLSHRATSLLYKRPRSRTRTVELTAELSTWALSVCPDRTLRTAISRHHFDTPAAHLGLSVSRGGRCDLVQLRGSVSGPRIGGFLACVTSDGFLMQNPLVLRRILRASGCADHEQFFSGQSV